MILNKDVIVGILALALLMSAVGGWNWWEKRRAENLNNLAELVYRFEEGELTKEDVERKVKDSSLEPYFLAVSSGRAGDVAKKLGGGELASLFLEKEAYVLWKEGKGEKALSLLKGISKDRFNYPSTLLLKATLYKALGDRERALALYRELVGGFRDTYFGQVAYALLLLESDASDTDNQR